MKCQFNIIRNGATGYAARIDIVSLNFLQRWIHSHVRGTGSDTNNYTFIGYTDISDISSTDTLEEVTDGTTGSVYDIINKREISGSHIEMELQYAGEES